MKKRGGISALVGGILALMLFAPCAIAGTEQDPEITDPEGDAALPESQRCDILSVWFWGETETSFNITIHLKSLNDIFETTNTFYCRVYFDYGNYIYNTDCLISEDSTIWPFHTWYALMKSDGNTGEALRINGTLNFEKSTITWIVPIDIIDGFGVGKTLENNHADAWMNIDLFVPVINYGLHIGFVPGDIAPGGSSIDAIITGEQEYGRDYTYLSTNNKTNETAQIAEINEVRTDLKDKETESTNALPGFELTFVFLGLAAILIFKRKRGN